MTLAFSMRFSALEGIGRPRLNCLALAGPHCGVVYDDLLRKTCARLSMLPSKIEKPIHIPAPGAAEAHPPGFPVYGRLPPPCASVRPRHRRPRPLGLLASGGLALDAPTPSACGAGTPEPPSAALKPHSASARSGATTGGCPWTGMPSSVAAGRPERALVATAGGGSNGTDSSR